MMSGEQEPQAPIPSLRLQSGDSIRKGTRVLEGSVTPEQEVLHSPPSPVGSQRTVPGRHPRPFPEGGAGRPQELHPLSRGHREALRSPYNASAVSSSGSPRRRHSGGDGDQEYGEEVAPGHACVVPAHPAVGAVRHLVEGRREAEEVADAREHPDDRSNNKDDDEQGSAAATAVVASSRSLQVSPPPGAPRRARILAGRGLRLRRRSSSAESVRS